MSTDNPKDTTRDKRRYGLMETRNRPGGGVAIYDITINGELWACVEWSPERRAWCIQDASGRCLAHLDAIHGENADAQTALALARRMILDGRMPTPEQADQQLQERLAQQQHDREQLAKLSTDDIPIDIEKLVMHLVRSGAAPRSR